MLIVSNMILLKFITTFLINIFFSIFVCANTTSQYDLSKVLNEEFVKIIVELGKEDWRDLRLRRLWLSAVEFSHEFESEITDKYPQLNVPEEYLNLNSSLRNRIKKSNPTLKLLEDLWMSSNSSKKVKHNNSLRKKLSVMRTKNIDRVNFLIESYHKDEIEFKFDTIDQLIGLQYNETERSIGQRLKLPVEAYVGSLKSRTQTSYEMLRKLFKEISFKKDDVFYDFGSGYGRVLIYGGILNPDVQFKGIELVSERVNEANRISTELGLKNVTTIESDILKMDYKDGTIFYMFNPFPSIMDKVMGQLREHAKKKPIRIIGVGASFFFMQKLSWLQLEKEIVSDRAIGVFRSIPVQ